MTDVVFIVSPYRGDIEQNEAFLAECFRDSIARGECPVAGHAMYPRVLMDADPEERALGVALGHVLMACSDRVAVYAKLGVSDGMRLDVAEAGRLGLAVDWR